jgi:hypothetical protein
MTQQPYLLTVLESVGGNEFLTRHLIKTEDYQKVKYHYHRTLKDWGWHDTPFDKHCLEGPHGLHSEIHAIEPLAPEEYEIMREYLGEWAKV